MVRLLDVGLDNPAARIDSSYFTRSGLVTEAVLRAGTHETIADVSESIASFGAYALTNQFTYQETGIPFLRCADIKNGFVSFGDTLLIDVATNQLLSKSQVEPETVLLTMSGSVGATAVALPSWNYPVNSNQDIAKIRTATIDPYYLTAFLGSRFGQAQIGRMPVGSVQQHIFLSMIERILVARLGEEIESKISGLLRSAFEAQEAATTHLAQAEADLLDALDLASWSPPEPLTYSRSAADVLAAGRLDAEFAAPKVQDLFEHLAAGGSTIANFANVRREKFQSTLPGFFRYIEIGDLDGFGRCATTKLDVDNAPSRATWRVHAHDVITSTVRPIRRLSAIIDTGQSDAICSSGFVVLRPTNVSPELLLTYLRLPLVAQLMHMFATASMYPALAEGDLLAMPMPPISQAVDRRVCEDVRASRARLGASERLLAAARRAVEIAINDGGPAALAFVTEQEAIHAGTT